MFRFFWNDYRDRGFKILFVEDLFLMVMFDNVKVGFRKKLIDFYNWFMVVVMEEISEIWFENNFCVLDRLEIDILLDYVYSLIRMMFKYLYFVLVYFLRMIYDYIEDVGIIDGFIYRFFDDFCVSRFLENIVVVLFSDYGMWFGEIRNIYIGKLEECLLLLNIIIFICFVNVCIKEMYNFMININWFIILFDIYEFLNYLLYFDDYKLLFIYGVSLMNIIFLNRICLSVMILFYWCMCIEMIIV